MRRLSVWLLALSLAASFTLLLVCVWVFPQLIHPPLSQAELRAVTNPKERIELQNVRAERQDAVRGLLLQGFGGLLLAAGAVATWRQIQISREGQITERFTRAIDQLGSDKLDVRLGGIYALERIAEHSPADRLTVMEVLTAFVRSRSPWPAGSIRNPEPHPTPTVDQSLPWLRERAADLQAAVLVLGRCPMSGKAGEKRYRPQLVLVDLRRAYFSHGRFCRFDFIGANLAHAGFRGTLLEESRLNYADLRLVKLADAVLTKADLRGAWLDEADLRKARLKEADLRDASLRGADLRGADLRGARLEPANLTDVRSDETTVWPDGFDMSRISHTAENVR